MEKSEFDKTGTDSIGIHWGQYLALTFSSLLIFFVSIYKTLDNLERIFINSVGEGSVWVCNINGNFENGDYITTCTIPGYGMKQDSDSLKNYTLGKITQDCDFNNIFNWNISRKIDSEGNIDENGEFIAVFVGCSYHCG